MPVSYTHLDVYKRQATSPTTVAPEPSKSAAEESKAEETAKAAVSGERMELTVWLTPSWKGVFSGDEPGADYDSFFVEAGKRYTENVNPNVTVKVEVIPGDSRDEKLNVAESTNTLPDIVYEGAFTMSSYYQMCIRDRAMPDIIVAVPETSALDLALMLAGKVL